MPFPLSCFTGQHSEGRIQVSSKEKTNEDQQKKQGVAETCWSVAGPSIGIVLAICVLFYFLQERGEGTLQSIYEAFNLRFGGVFLYAVFAILVIIAILIFTPIGKIKLGEGAPRYSTLSWFSMLFCACMGSSLLYWGLIEWAYYMQQPPFGILPMSGDAADWSVTYAMFHWGISGWGTYSLAAVIIAYFFFVRKIPAFSISASCGQIHNGERTGFGKILDIVIVVGLCAGVAISVALGTPLVAAGINRIFGWQESVLEYLLIIIFWAALFGVCAFKGMDGGVKTLANINSIIAIIFILCVFLLGNSTFIFNNITNGIGLMLQNFLRMSFYTDPRQINGFAQDWTMFYWEWWVAFVPVMGLFIAKISQGRTIRQVAGFSTLFGSLGCWAYMGILGSYGLEKQLSGALDTVAILESQGPYEAIMQILESLPFGTFFIAVFVVLAFIFLATTCDSSAYMLATVTAKRLTVDDEPKPICRLMWCIVIVLWPIVMLFTGGQNSVKLCSVLGSVALLFLVALMIVNFFKDVKRYQAGEPMQTRGRKKNVSE